MWTDGYYASIFDPPSWIDIPTITIDIASDSTTLTSPVITKPAIVGTGHQTMGWDGLSDTAFLFHPAFMDSGNGGQGDYALYGSIKTGGEANFARWPVVFDFVTNSQCIEIPGFALGGGGSLMVEVNGHLVTDMLIEVTPNTGRHQAILRFPLAASRRIRLYLTGTYGLEAIRTTTGTTVTKAASAFTKKYAIIGDSWVDGASGVSNLETWAPRMIRAVGGPFAGLCLLGIGGRGWTVSATNPYSISVPQALYFNPDVLIFYGSQNDPNIDISATVTATLALCAGVPKVIVIPTLLSAFDVQTASVQAATVAAGRQFIDLRDYVTGTGSIAAPNGTGTADRLLLSTANLHMSIEGHRAVAKDAFLGWSA